MSKILDPVEPLTARFDSSGELVFGGIPISRLASRAGSTPFYALDRSLVRQRVASLRGQLPKEVRLHFAIKSNPMPALACEMARQIDGLDVASGGELALALDSGMAPGSISFAGPGKTEDELARAAASGALIIAESAREIRVLSDLRKRTGWKIGVALRINPAFEIRGSGVRMGGGPRPFGVDSESVPALLETLNERGLEFRGFHFFPGSQNLNAQSIIEAHNQSYELALQLAGPRAAELRFLNLGGGFGIPYFPGDRPLDVPAIAANLHRLVERGKSDFPQAEWVIELGRYLVGEAGIYVARVLDRKVSRGRTFLVVDGGLHHHLAATGHFGQVLRRNYPVTLGRNTGIPDDGPVSVVGPLCTPLDLLGQDLSLPRAEPGDFVVVHQSGAYGASASPAAFLGHPPAVELLI